MSGGHLLTREGMVEGLSISFGFNFQARAMEKELGLGWGANSKEDNANVKVKVVGYFHPYWWDVQFHVGLSE